MCRLALLAAIILNSGAAWAQQDSAQLRGVVRDQQNAAVADVALEIRNQDTGTSRTAVSNDDGTYFVGALQPGTYVITAFRPGFKPHTRAGMLLEVGRTAVVDVALTVGSFSDVVTVTATLPLIDVTATELGGHITSRELQELPSINRSFVGFVALLPAIAPSLTTDAFGAESVTVNGLDARSTNYLVDGTNNNDDFLGQRAGTQVRTPIEAVQEFEVLTHQFDAEFGRTAGAVINAVTRQGSNVLRGTAFWFYRDDRLMARDYFAKQNNLPAPDSQQHQYGGVLGGPIVRDKAHFFVSLERVQQDRPATVNIPARPEHNTTVTTTGRVLNTLVRVDQQVSSTQAWNIRWLRESSPQHNLLIPVGGRQATTAAKRDEFDVDQIAAARLHSVVGRSGANMLRVAFTRENVAFANPGFNSNGRQQDLLPATRQYATYIDQQSDVAQARINNGYSVDDTISWFVPNRAGSHDLKFGVQYQLSTVDATNESTRNGVFEFGSDTPFDPANPSSYPERLQIRVPGPSAFYVQAHFVSAFAQNNWRPNSRLTVSLGARYDLELIPIRTADTSLVDTARYPVDANNLAPRFGAAYSLDASARSVLRVGYGVFYDKTSLELISPVLTAGAFSDSFVAVFPANAPDPGPSRGELPTEPLLRGGPTVDLALLRQLFPEGARIPNTGTVYFDNPRRRVPKSYQFSLGYERQIGGQLTAGVDYLRGRARDQFISRDLNPGLRAGTSRTGVVTRPNPQFTSSVLQHENLGRIDYDALAIAVRHRPAGLFSARLAYTLSYARGNTSGNGIPQIPVQQQDDLRLEANQGPTDFDRRHHLVAAGSVRLPGLDGLTISAVARAMSGLPFTPIDSTTDADRNAILFDILPAGVYSGMGPNAIRVSHNGMRNGAYGPGVFQIDLRIGYRRLLVTPGWTLDVFGEIFNIGNRPTFDNPAMTVLGHPAADRRLPDFLVLRTLRPGTVPRTGQVGIRFGFG